MNTALELDLAKREVADKIRLVMQPGWVLTDERFDALCERLASIVQYPLSQAHKASQTIARESRSICP